MFCYKCNKYTRHGSEKNCSAWKSRLLKFEIPIFRLGRMLLSKPIVSEALSVLLCNKFQIYRSTLANRGASTAPRSMLRSRLTFWQHCETFNYTYILSVLYINWKLFKPVCKLLVWDELLNWISIIFIGNTLVCTSTYVCVYWQHRTFWISWTEFKIPYTCTCSPGWKWKNDGNRTECRAVAMCECLLVRFICCWRLKQPVKRGNLRAEKVVCVCPLQWEFCTPFSCRHQFSFVHFLSPNDLSNIFSNEADSRIKSSFWL